MPMVLAEVGKIIFCGHCSDAVQKARLQEANRFQVTSEDPEKETLTVLRVSVS